MDNQKMVIIIRLHKSRDDKSNTKSLKLEKIKSSRLLLPTASMQRLRLRRHVEVYITLL
jgi:hypothetical protein